jgi:hypothetical protein
MKLKAKSSPDKQTVTVRVPLQIRRRGGRKLVIAPDGANVVMLPRSRLDSTIVKALARAFRWRKLLEDGTHATIAEIAAAEKINESYVGRVLRLTLLAPDIIEAILAGRQPSAITLAVLTTPFPLLWKDQRRAVATDRT